MRDENSQDKDSAMAKRKKTIKERKWLKTFFKTGDKTKAAEVAYNLGSKGGSKTSKQKKRTANAIGQNVSKKLADEIDAYYKKQNINIEWVLKRLVRKADFSLSELTQIKALELIGKHKKMFVDRVESEIDFKNLKIIRPDIDFEKE